MRGHQRRAGAGAGGGRLPRPPGAPPRRRPARSRERDGAGAPGLGGLLRRPHGARAGDPHRRRPLHPDAHPAAARVPGHARLPLRGRRRPRRGIVFEFVRRRRRHQVRIYRIANRQRRDIVRNDAVQERQRRRPGRHIHAHMRDVKETDRRTDGVMFLLDRTIPKRHFIPCERRHLRLRRHVQLMQGSEFNRRGGPLVPGEIELRERISARGLQPDRERFRELIRLNLPERAGLGFGNNRALRKPRPRIGVKRYETVRQIVEPGGGKASFFRKVYQRYCLQYTKKTDSLCDIFFHLIAH